MGIKYIDAKRLRRVLIGGGKWIQKHEKYLNELNVYPVPDGDTGSNMSMTAQSMINEIEENTDNKTSMEELVDFVEEAVLIGARGNSGTIFSQIVTGFLKEIRNKKRLVPKDIALALQSSKELAYSVVNNPVEGTMLTVIRMVSERAKELENLEFFDKFIEKLVETAYDAVQQTPELLPKLKEAGVVDSGGMGIYYFFVGMLKVLTEIDLLTEKALEEKEFNKSILNIDHSSEDIKYKYCTEFIVRNVDFDIEDFKNKLLEIGDSAVFAKSSKKFKTHIHTNNPGLVIEIASSYGDLEKIKIENMKLQNEGVIQNEKDLAKIFVNTKNKSIKKEAYIILADTVELKDEFLKMGADVVILGGQSKNPSVNDIITACSKVLDDKKIYILPNNKNVIATAKLASDKIEKTVIVIPTKTMLEGMFYLQYPNDIIKVKNNMKDNNISCEITKAVRDTTIDGMKISIGDYLLLIDTKIQYVNNSLDKLVDYFIEKYITDRTLAITVVEGINKNEEILNKFKTIKRNLTAKTKIIETESEYDYYIYVENRKENMPELAIITDSASDLEEKEIEDLPLSIVSVRLENEGNTYREGKNITRKEFWSMIIEDKKMFKTSQPSPKEIENLYKELFRKGYKKILVIPLSSKLSGSIQVYKLASTMLKRENDITIYDSKAIAILLGYIAKQAAIRSIRGDSVESIIKYLDAIVEKSKLYIIIDDIKYLEATGRITKVAKTIGYFLNMKPIITIQNGMLITEKKVIGGDNAAYKYLEKSILEKSRNHSLYLMAGFGGEEKQQIMAQKIINSFSNNKKITILNPIREIGATVGTHAGPVYGALIVPKLL